ncbi:hypothetical protein ABIE26_002045 [Pedobacter africanus]|uniref:Uncharacterized protein n=1 Tax=Pedobacter africanus TaxID=151894 RepID=A0ACC6KQH5_9SPHI|nr:DUF6528 family protein [Pedobacter africanus]MDR6781467.1 hypothetical protein [Pedobacter africanus]
MKRNLILCALFTAGLIWSCGKNNTAEPPVVKPPFVSKPPEAFAGFLTVLTNDASKRIEIYDPTIENWNSAEAKKWSWAPATSLGFVTADVSTFGGGTDFKLRKVPVWNNAEYAAITDNSFAAIVEYPSGQRKWSKRLSGNLHSAELLPNGNIAIAASDGGWIRLYASSQGPDQEYYAEYPLISAHAVLWDPTTNVLWVTGQHSTTKAHILTALAIGGTAAMPELTEIVSWRITIPSAWGHEISPYYGNSNLLWVTSNGGEYLFNKSTKSFSVAPTAGLTFVKGMANQLSGQIVLTRPDYNKIPRPAMSCGLNDWSTSTVDFYSSGGQLDGTRVVNGACFYKVKLLNSNYQ